ncbi:MAG: linear amide C-N hydrolase, partial [Clostridia bacterium]|nr:linear amide C-N hydrolase [Clostridia bacterium]
MCTALNLLAGDHYFGRNLDLDKSYGEEVCVMPRNFVIEFKTAEALDSHYAMIGMATVVSGVPLFYDATNEHGLSMAGLNFPENAYFPPFEEGKDNITPFEFIPWILGKCRTVKEARVLLSRINLVNIPFSDNLPLSPLHWIISDKTESVTAESMENGLHIHENPVGVLTNNPPFEYQMFNLNNYRKLSVTNGGNNYMGDVKLEEY